MTVIASAAEGAQDPALQRRFYRDMLRIRMIEEEIAARYPEEKMRCPVHLSIGQEAVPVGVSAALRPDDQVVSTHRCHAHYLAKGGDLKAMLAELYGKAAGCCGGRGGSMHLFDGAAGVLLSLPIVASSIPIGVGAAFGFQQQGRDAVCVVYLGDASVEEGVFHESANFAALRKIPAIFVCENNLYSVYTRLDDRQPQRPIERVAEAHGIPASRIDGNDVASVHRTAAQAVDRARRGAGPSFIVADTYRWREHCGPNYDNDIGYRTAGEYETWRRLDPVARQRQRLVADRVLTEAGEGAMVDAILREIDEGFAFAEAAPFPAPGTAGDGIYG